MSKEYCINNNIKAEFIQLVQIDGTIRDKISIKEALEIADSLDLDLVEVASKEGVFPICKMMDYEKMKYKESKVKKPQVAKAVKEMRVSYNIGSNDLKVKNKKVIEFLDKQHKVKYVLQLKGREKGMIDTAKQKMRTILEEFTDKASWVQTDVVNCNNMTSITVLLNPI
jgi:translation initiation factor IF-3